MSRDVWVMHQSMCEVLSSVDTLPEPCLRREIHRKGPEPVAAFVMLSGNKGQRCVRMLSGGGEQRRDACIPGRQSVRDTLEHPGTAEVEPVDMGELGIGPVSDHTGRQPRRTHVAWNLRQE